MIDPYLFGEIARLPNGGNKYAFGKAVRDPRNPLGENVGVFIVAGQSNACNVCPTSFTPTNASKVDNLSIYDGGTYEGKDPLLGCETGTGTAGVGNPFTRMADKLVTDGTYDRVILIPVGQGATTMNEWATLAGLYDRILVAFRRAAAVGLTVTGVLWMQGESDNIANTSQASYTADATSLINRIRSAGFLAPWLIGVCTYYTSTVEATVQAAQAALVNGTYIFAGANTDTLTTGGGNRQADGTHLNDTGAAAAGNLWAAAVVAAL